MKAFFIYISTQFRMDLRDRGTLLHYYLVPLMFFAVVGPVFSSINPTIKPTLAATMTLLAVTMGAVMGMPLSIVRLRETGSLRAFRISGIPDGAVLAVHAISAFVHLTFVTVIIYFLSPLALHSVYPAAPTAYFGVVALFLAASIGVGLLVGVASRSQSLASVISMLLFFPSILLSGIMFPASALPVPAERFGRIFPATHALQALYGYAYRTHPDFSPAAGLIALAGTALLTAGVSVFLFCRIGHGDRT